MISAFCIGFCLGATMAAFAMTLLFAVLIGGRVE